MRVGRVDAVVQSTDKNFLVPVGGCIIAGGVKDDITAIGEVRAMNSPLPTGIVHSPISCYLRNSYRQA